MADAMALQFAGNVEFDNERIVIDARKHGAEPIVIIKAVPFVRFAQQSLDLDTGHSGPQSLLDTPQHAIARAGIAFVAALCLSPRGVEPAECRIETVYSGDEGKLDG